MDLLKNKSESVDIYQTLCNSQSMYRKCLKLEGDNITEALNNTLGVLSREYLSMITGSTGEGTDIASDDSMTPCYISDIDIMQVFCQVQVIDEGDTLPQRFDNYMYCQAEKGEHTTDGFRKLRIIHNPEYYLTRHYSAKRLAHTIHRSVVHGFISSSKFLASTTLSATKRVHPAIKTGLGTQGPSQMMEEDGSPYDVVKCFYVKTLLNEAELWFTRQGHWPDMKLKSKIRKIGYLLVPTGNSKSHESDIEWRCSFSIAEKILFQSLPKFQRLTFVILKVLLKEYLPSHINTDGEKQLLSTYHMKTLFLWCLEDSQVKWEPGDMLENIGFMFDKLLSWIDQKYFPHYFIPSVNLLDGRRLHGRDKSLICIVSAIRNYLSIKIKQSRFFMGQEPIRSVSLAHRDMLDDRVFLKNIHHYVMKCITGKLHSEIHKVVLRNMNLRELNVSHSVLIDSLISVEMDVDPQVQHLYQAMYTDPIHDKLLKEVVPGLINQYRGCIHMAKYCMAARDGYVLPDVLHTAESLLRETLHLDPCSGYVKLACLYIVTGNFSQSLDILHAAENHFLLKHKIIGTSDLKNVQLNRVEVDRVSTEVLTAITREVFQKWADGQFPSNIVLTWREYITVPDLVQFELIHDGTQPVTGVHVKAYGPGKLVSLDSFLQFPPLSLIKLLKFVCTFYSGRSATSHMDILVVDMIASSLSVIVFPGVNDKSTVLNMAAWCYIKLKKYKPATRIIMMAIESSLETEIMKICAFSYHMSAYVIAQCLL